MPNYKFEDRSEQRLRGMQAFDRAAAAEDRVSLASERLQLQRDRDETNRTFREAEAAAKAEQRASELGLRERIVSGRESQFAVANELTRTRQQLEADKLEFQKEKALREAEWAKQINPLKLQHEKVKLDRDASDFALDNVQATKMNEDTQGFNSHMAELYARGAAPDEVKAGFGVGLITFPHADPKRLALVGSNLFRKPNGEPMTLDEMSAAAAALREAHPGARISVSQKGGASFSEEAIPPALKAEAGRLDKEYYTEVSAWQAWKKANPKKAAPNEAKIEELRTKRDEVGAQIHALNNPAQVPAPSTTDRPVFRDKHGNRAYKNPDGSFEPIQ